MTDLEDHRLPLVALKEQRRELVISLLGRTGPLCQSAIQELATIQSALCAVEMVIADFDAEFLDLDDVIVSSKSESNDHVSTR